MNGIRHDVYREVAAGRMTAEQGMRQLEVARDVDDRETQRREVLGWLVVLLFGAAIIIAGQAFGYAPPHGVELLGAAADAGTSSAGLAVTLPAADVPDDLVPTGPAAVDGAGDVKLQDDGAQLALLALSLAAAGMWGPFAAVVLALLIWAARKFGRKLIPRAAVFFDQPLVAALLPTVAAIAVDVALALKAGTPLSLALFMRSIGLGLGANGAFNIAMKLREQRAAAAGTAAAATVTDRKSAADALNDND